jgi:ATP-dependent RNA helicase DeaD
MEEKFTNIVLDEELQRAISDLNYTSMTPVQASTIALILDGKDVVAKAPTGTGKTAAYAIPLIQKIDPLDDSVQMLVVCPTRELAVQSLEEIQKFTKYKEGIRSMVIYGGQDIEKQILTLKKRPQIVVGTPGRIMDHQRRGTLKIKDLKFLVLDEADEMLRMGFKEDVDSILEDVKGEHQTVLFSATMPKEILALTNQYQKDHTYVEINSETKLTVNIKQYYVEVKESNKEETLRRFIDANGYNLCLVFCRTKKRVDQLALSLQEKGYNVESLHGDLKQAQRDNVMKMFKSGLINILIATDVAARGLDINDIEAVFNFDVTDDNEYYIHRIGRTGRASRNGAAYTFVTKKEKELISVFEKLTNTKIEKVLPPSQESARTRKVNDFLTKIQAKLTDNSYLEYVEYVKQFEQLVNSNNEVFYKPQEITAAFLAHEFALFDKALKESEAKEAAETVEREEINSNYTRLFINLGKKDGVIKDDIIKLFHDKVGVKKNEFNDLYILDSYSFVEIPRDYLRDAIKNLLNTDYFGRNIFIEEAIRRGKKNKDSDSSPKESSSRSRRSERSSDRREEKRSGERTGKRREERRGSERTSSRNERSSGERRRKDSKEEYSSSSRRAKGRKDNQEERFSGNNERKSKGRSKSKNFD